MEMSCRACNSASRPVRIGDFGSTSAQLYHTSSFSLWACPICEVAYLAPLPTADDIRLMYQDTVQFAGFDVYDEARTDGILAYYKGVLNAGLISGDPAVLEVGAGKAWVTRAVRALIPTARTYAQDITPECVNDCPWVDSYFVGDLEDFSAPEPFDLISLTHVIEHLTDPAGVISGLAKWLRPGGRILLTAPHKPEGWHVGAGREIWEKYSYFYVPGHISYLSEKWFTIHQKRWGLKLEWFKQHESGQSFEAVLYSPI